MVATTPWISRTMTARASATKCVGNMNVMRQRVRIVGMFLATAMLSGGICAQSEAEHEAHHPAGATAPAATENGQESVETESVTSDPAMAGMMSAAPMPETYPSLIALPELSPEKRAELQTDAIRRMTEGMQLISAGVDALGKGVEQDDLRAMEEATGIMHEGLARFDSGVATQRALAEDTPPQTVALQWFRREMSLPDSAVVQHVGADTSWFHWSLMLGLGTIALGLLALRFLALRRTRSLLAALGGASAGGAASVAVELPVSPAPPSAGDDNLTGKRWSGHLKVGRIIQETVDVKTYRLMNPSGGVLPLSFLPGQFMTVSLTVDGKSIKRSYTIASAPTQRDYLELTVKHAPGGLLSGHMHTQLREGDLLELSGPYGSLVFTGRECKCILLIAGGVGITPMMSVIRYLLDRSWPGDVFLLYGCRAPADIIFREELEYLRRRHPNFHLAITVSESDGTWSGPVGRITRELIVETVPDLPSRYVHLCGPAPMMEATREILQGLGVLSARIKTEAFGPAIGKVELTRGDAQPSANSATSPQPAARAAFVVSFAKSHKSAVLKLGQVVLEAAEAAGVDIDYSCRAGTCGLCRVKLVSGSVSMAVEDGLQPGDKENHIILACQAVAVGNIEVDA